MALLEHVSSSKWVPTPSELLELVESICDSRDNTLHDALGHRMYRKSFKNAFVREYVRTGHIMLDNDNNIIDLLGSWENSILVHMILGINHRTSNTIYNLYKGGKIYGRYY